MICIKKFLVGNLNTNNYLIYNSNFISKEAFLIDISIDCLEIINFLMKNNFNLAAVFILHAHYDHLEGIDDILQAISQCSNIY